MIPFFQALWGDAPGRWGELRVMRNGQMTQHFIDLQTSFPFHAASDESFYQAAQERDVFYGVLPRDEQSGKAKDVPPWTNWLWADVDAKQFVSPLPSDYARNQKAMALTAINSFHTRPQIIVDSGHGYHCYWRLDRLEPLDRAQAVMAYIADSLHGDRVHDAPRILRVPGTRNFKYIPAAEVRLLVFNTVDTVRLADFEGYLPVAGPPKVKRASYAPAKAYTDLPEWLQDTIDRRTPQGGRSEECFRVVLWLQRYGWDYAAAEELFDAFDTGIGEKYAEKGSDGPRWFAQTWRAAESAA